jgi:hypothetical protein
MRNCLIVSSHPRASAYTRRRVRAVRHAQAPYRHHLHSEDVTQITRQITYRRHQAFYWSWAEPIGAISDPQAAAGRSATSCAPPPSTPMADTPRPGLAITGTTRAPRVTSPRAARATR